MGPYLPPHVTLADLEPLPPILTVYSAGSVFILRNWEGYTESVDARDSAAVLWAVAEQLVNLGSRYDAKRVTIGYTPGDKHHDNHSQPCSECACKCDPDQSTALDMDGLPFCPSGYAQRYHGTSCVCPPPEDSL